ARLWKGKGAQSLLLGLGKEAKEGKEKLMT
ncbi:hypothetical protein A2U01_0105580, partial [Trifolium medium]|nr:hypothetical protein [Trifolium medium]